MSNMKKIGIIILLVSISQMVLCQSSENKSNFKTDIKKDKYGFVNKKGKEIIEQK